MFLKKTGLPQESEIVLCTVTKIYHNSVFATLDEYIGRQGLIHISEVSPGRIRNLRDFITEGKLVVCKVIRVDRQKEQIDLSLRRVTEGQRREKINWMKQEQLAEKIIEFVAQETKTDKQKLFATIAKAIEKNYESIYHSFYDIVENVLQPDSLGLEKNVSAKLEEIIRQRIKPKQVEIKGDLTLETYDPNGVEIVKNALLAAEKVSEQLVIIYEGGGKYRLTVIAEDYKTAEEILKNAYEEALNIIEKAGGKGEFKRIEA